MLIPPGSNFIYERALKDPKNINHCIEYYLFVGSIADRFLRAKALLLGQMTSEPAFDQLRTKEQLGYVVWSGARYASTTLGYRVIIQSERTAKYLESRIDAFLSAFGKTLEDMPDDIFEGHKRSIINKRLEKLKNLNSEANRFSSHISSEYFDFKQHEIDAETLRALTKAEMIAFYRQYIDPEAVTRAKLSIHLNAQCDGGHTAAPAQKDTIVQQLDQFLASCEIKVDSDKFKQAFECVTIDSDNQAAALSTIRDFLGSEMKLGSDQVESAMQKVSEYLGPVLRSLGIETPASDGGANDAAIITHGNGATVVPRAEPTYITSVPEFKARLGVSAAPTPVVDLSEFEDLEPKL
jgi:insulysin